MPLEVASREITPTRVAGVLTRSLMLFISGALVLVAALLLLGPVKIHYHSSMSGETESGRCKHVVAAFYGGGTAAPFAYGAYQLDPSAEASQVMSAIEKMVVEHAAAFEQLWHEEDNACRRDLRVRLGVGIAFIAIGPALFRLRRRLPGRLREPRDLRDGTLVG